MIGLGFDVHRLEPNRPLVLGGIHIPSDIGSVSHSDGDVLLHALVDALLGAVGKGDIGEHFPDSDPQWRGAPSSVFVEHAVDIIQREKCTIVNVDCTLVLERPKVLPYKALIKQNIARLCCIDERRVNVKATTNEHLGYVGRGEGVHAWVICEVVPL